MLSTRRPLESIGWTGPNCELKCGSGVEGRGGSVLSNRGPLVMF